jgi:GT2 family glycosyltransferase
MAALTSTVVVATRNRGSMIQESLRSLLALQEPGLQILVIDQSTDDSTLRAIAEVTGSDPRLRVHSTRTTGLARGRNIGIQLSTSDVVAFTDDDCVVDPGWLKAVLREFDSPSVAAVYGRVIPPGSHSRTGTEIAYKPSQERTLYVCPVPPWYIGHGANMAMRRSDLLAIGGFDPMLGAGTAFPAGEDLDIAYRLLRAGRHVVYSGSALAYHRNWRDWPSRKRTERGYGVGAGALFMKYIRCGDPYGVRLLGTWIWQLGVRRVCAGLLKWRSPRPMYLGYCQLLYLWIGLIRSRAMTLNRRNMLYLDSAHGALYERAFQESHSSVPVPRPGQQPAVPNDGSEALVPTASDLILHSQDAVLASQAGRNPAPDRSDLATT